MPPNAAGIVVTMKVICPSYGRTGTKSMQAALDILGFGPCYDSELAKYPSARVAIQKRETSPVDTDVLPL